MGQHLARHKVSLPEIQLESIHFPTQGRGLYPPAAEWVFKSTNGGATVRPKSLPPDAMNIWGCYSECRYGG